MDRLRCRATGCGAGRITSTAASSPSIGHRSDGFVPIGAQTAITLRGSALESQHRYDSSFKQVLARLGQLVAVVICVTCALAAPAEQEITLVPQRISEHCWFFQGEA